MTRPGVRGGREQRQKRRQVSNTPTIITGVKRALPTYEILSNESIDLIELHIDRILKEIGVEFRGDHQALELWREAGADVKGERVRFDPGHVRDIISQTTPSSFTMHARNPNRSVLIGDNNVVFAPAYGAPFVRDMDNGRRYGTIEDFQNLIKLSYSIPWLHHSGGTVCEPVDLPVNKRHLDMVYAHLRYSDMPFMGSVTTPERAEDSIEMARIVFGHEYVDQHCVIMGNINMNSPLVYDQAMSGSLRAYARANQCPVIVPFVLGGATGPVTMAGALAQAFAEVLVGVALGQLERPGSPAVLGNFVTSVDLKTGSPTFGTPEPVLASWAAGQLARRIGLPLRCSGAFTSSKIADAQAAQESTNAMLTAVISGANFVLHAAGWLECALTVGYEKLLIDADYLGALHTLLQGINLDENGFAMQAFKETEPGNHFFGCQHTLANFETAYFESGIADNRPFEQWQEEGELDALQRANKKYKSMLRNYQQPELNLSVDEALQDYMLKRKDEMPDIWH